MGVAHLTRGGRSCSWALYRAYLLYLPNVKIYRKVGRRSVNNFCTCNKECRCWVATSNLNPCFDTHFCPKLQLQRKILFASTEVVHRPRSDSPLHLDIENIWQTYRQSSNFSTRRLLAADLLERWPHICCVKITFTLLPTKLFQQT